MVMLHQGNRCAARLLAIASLLLAGGTIPAPSAEPVKGQPAVDSIGDPLPAGASARLGTLRFRLPSTSIAYSPDGKVLASGGADNRIVLFDSATGKKIRTLAGHQDRQANEGQKQQDITTILISTTGRGNVTCLAFSPDGQTLASGGWDDSVRLWDVGTGIERHKMHAHPGMVAAVAFSPDGKVLASRGGLDGVVRLWSSNGVKLRQLEWLSKVNPWRFNRQAALAFAPDSKTLAVGDTKGIHLLDVQTGKERQTLTGQRSTLCVAFSPDGKLLAGGGVDAGKDNNSLRLWDLEQGQELRRCALPKNEPPIALAFSPDGTRLAAVIEEDDLRVFETASGKAVLRLPHYWPSRVVYAPDGKTLVSCGGPVVRRWDAASGKEQLTWPGPKKGITSVALLQSGSIAATGGEDVQLWHPRTGTPLNRIAVPGGVNALALTADGKLLATAGRDRKVRLWQVDPMHVTDIKETRALESHTLPLCGLAFSPDGKRLISGDVQSVLRIWDVAQGKELHVINNRSGTEHLSFAFSPDGKTVACAGAWNDSSFLPAAGTMMTIQGKQVKSDGRFKIQGVEMERKEGYRVLVWEAASGKPLHSLSGLGDKITAVAYAPDGSTLAAASRDGTVALWDAKTGRERLFIRAHGTESAALRGSTTQVLFTRDGKTLISAGSDGKIRLWDAATGRQRSELSASEGAVQALALDRDGKLLLSGHADTTALIWDLTALPPGPDKKEQVLFIGD
jgi:WD40 repeat protein